MSGIMSEDMYCLAKIIFAIDKYDELGFTRVAICVIKSHDYKNGDVAKVVKRRTKNTFEVEITTRGGAWIRQYLSETCQKYRNTYGLAGGSYPLLGRVSAGHKTDIQEREIKMYLVKELIDNMMKHESLAMSKFVAEVLNERDVVYSKNFMCIETPEGRRYLQYQDGEYCKRQDLP